MLDHLQPVDECDVPNGFVPRPLSDDKPCYLDALPDELILAIVSQLEVHRGYMIDDRDEEKRKSENRLILRSLCSLGLTCKRLARISLPQLYSTFIESSPERDRCALILRTIAKRPELAHYIRYIELSTMGARIYDRFPLGYTEGERLIIEQFMPNHPAVTRYFKALSLPNRGRPYSPYMLSSLRECAKRTPSVLILLADNLQAIASSFTSSVRGPLAHREASSTSQLQTWWTKDAFHRGSRFTVSAGANTRNSLQDFAYIYESNDGAQNPYLSDAELAIITAIECSFFLVDSSNLEEIFDCCTGLRKFSCKWIDRGPNNELADYMEIDLPKIHGLLGRFSSTLEYLKLDSMDAGCLVDMDVDVEAFGSLRGFTALTHLDISGLVLWGDYDNHNWPNLSTLLPESLEKLKIDVEWDDDVEEAFYLFLTECSTMQPRLSNIECSWSAAPEIIAIDLVESFRRLGIELVLYIHAPGVEPDDRTST